ncbi:MAG: alpha/beta fold hydrolase [Candidatus Micrarchaeota archaeon]
MRPLLVFLSVFILMVGCIQLPGGAAKPSGGSSNPPSTGGATPAGQNNTSGTPPSQDTSDTGNETEQETEPPPQDTSTGETEDAGTGGADTAGQPSETSLESMEISYSSGAWKVYGTLYPSKIKTPTRAILLLPQLGKTRDSYPISFIESLHEQFPESVVVALDMRGHGKSTNLGTYQSFDTAGYKDMKTDVLTVKEYIEPNYPNIESYYVVGASMGSSAAILAGAQESKIHKIVMISPGMEYQGVNIERACEDYQHDVLAVSSSSDAYSVQSSSEMVSIRGTAHTQVKTYTGSAHGTDMFDATENEPQPMAAAIVEFLK